MVVFPPNRLEYDRLEIQGTFLKRPASLPVSFTLCLAIIPVIPTHNICFMKPMSRNSRF